MKALGSFVAHDTEYNLKYVIMYISLQNHINGNINMHLMNQENKKLHIIHPKYQTEKNI